MPVSFIDAPEGIRADAKKQLVKDVYEAIHEAYPIPDTRILLREWPNDKVSQDGRLGSEPLRPICWLEVPPGISIEAKRRLVRRISEAISAAYHLSKQEVRLPSGSVVSTNWVLTFFREYPLDKAALDSLLALENPMVLESLEGTMTQSHAEH
jgi:phenylpyruvate tautomerase PptA (4-oxalocrotonate tautomerase family)